MRVVCHLLVASRLVPLATSRDAIDRPALVVRRPSVRADGDPRWRASKVPLARLFAVLEDLDALLPPKPPQAAAISLELSRGVGTRPLTPCTGTSRRRGAGPGTSTAGTACPAGTRSAGSGCPRTCRGSEAGPWRPPSPGATAREELGSSSKNSVAKGSVSLASPRRESCAPSAETGTDRSSTRPGSDSPRHIPPARLRTRHSAHLRRDRRPCFFSSASAPPEQSKCPRHRPHIGGFILILDIGI